MTPAIRRAALLALLAAVAAAPSAAQEIEVSSPEPGLPVKFGGVRLVQGRTPFTFSSATCWRCISSRRALIACA